MSVEYYRSVFKASSWERLIAVGFTFVAAIGWAVARKDGPHPPSGQALEFRKFLFVAYGVCFAIYLFTYLKLPIYPPRVLYPMFAGYAVFYAFGICQLVRRYARGSLRFALGAFCILLVLINLSMCRKANAYHTMDFLPAADRAADSGSRIPG